MLVGMHNMLLVEPYMGVHMFNCNVPPKIYAANATNVPITTPKSPFDKGWKPVITYIHATDTNSRFAVPNTVNVNVQSQNNGRSGLNYSMPS